MARSEHMRPPVFHLARPHLLRPVRIDPTGKAGPTPAQARASGWRRTSQGYYLPADVDGEAPEQRIVEAGHYLTGVASVTGWAALHWAGALWLDGREWTGEGSVLRPVDVVVRRGKYRGQPGIRVTSELVAPGERAVVDGLAVTSPRCATAFAMRYAFDARAAGRVLSMAAATDLVSIDEMRAYQESLHHRVGIPQLRRGLVLAEENAWSPWEYDLALTWTVDAGLPRPRLNEPVFDLAGRHVGTPDLIDTTAGVVGEFNGEVHLRRKRRATDLKREGAFRRLGLECFTAVAEDFGDREQLIARMRDCYARARSRPASDRQWTVVLPRWWTPTHTVALRRVLTPAQRERYLAYRRAC